MASNWIPKELWLAVNFAAKMVRENGYFNKAVNTAANYYKVNPNDVERELRKRQAKGQKGSKRGTYKWWVVELLCATDADPEWFIEDIKVVKALNEKNARSNTWDTERMSMLADYGGSYAPFYVAKANGPFNSKKEAEDHKSKYERG